MLPRRGSRPIEVDGHSLRWWVRGRCGSDSVVLAHASRSGMIVRVHVPEPWMDDVVPITPARVAWLARKALAPGWLPGQGKGEFAGDIDEMPPPRAFGALLRSFRVARTLDRTRLAELVRARVPEVWRDEVVP